VCVHLLTHRRARGFTAAHIVHSSSVAARDQHIITFMLVKNAYSCLVVIGIGHQRPVSLKVKHRYTWQGLDHSNERPDICSGSPMA